MYINLKSPPHYKYSEILNPIKPKLFKCVREGKGDQSGDTKAGGAANQQEDYVHRHCVCPGG